MRADISQLSRLTTFNSNKYKNMQILACLQDEVRNGNYKHKMSSTGKRLGRVTDGYIFHSLMHDSLAVLHWEVHIAILSDLCFVLRVFKTWKYFQTVLTNFLKYELQCTFNKVWTKAKLPVMLTKSSGKHRSSPWICLFGSLVVLLLSFLGMGFSTKWPSGDNLLSMKKKNPNYFRGSLFPLI